LISGRELSRKTVQTSKVQKDEEEDQYVHVAEGWDVGMWAVVVVKS